ncbi:MAG: hypothetical protein JJ958_14675 [Balneola sp.]|nr:hypothetical protein [Balneola sp.]
MMKKLLYLILIPILISCGSSKYAIEQPGELIEDQPLSSQEEGWLKLGIISHDEGDYKQAKEYYKRILKQKPYSASALYEISYSSMESKNLEEALVYLKQGERIDSESLYLFYHMHGITLDQMGKPYEAIKAFKKGIEVNPEFHLLHYSLAITSINVGDENQGMISLQNAILSNFEHSSSHLLLGNMYRNQGNSIPAILAYTYFLFYEQNTARSDEVFQAINGLFDSAERDTASNEINITINSLLGGSGDKEQMKGLEMVLSIHSVASKYSEDNKKLSEIEFIAGSYDYMLGLIEESQDDYEEKGFVREHYAPYLIQVKEAGYLETLVYLLFENSGYEGVKNWIINDCVKCEEFYEWTPE